MMVEFPEFWTYPMNYSTCDFMNFNKGLSSENGLSDLQCLYLPLENFDGTSKNYSQVLPSLYQKKYIERNYRYIMNREKKE